MATVSPNPPMLTRFSQYPSSPRYSVTGKRKIRDRTDKTPAANKYDIRELVTRTSKFGALTRSCSFSQADRFPKGQYNSVTKGPGQYDTARSTLSKRDVGFGKSTRPPINGVPQKTPGPIYDVLDKNKRMEPTLSQTTCSVAGRHGWYYENREATKKPGVGTYEPSYSQIELPLGQDCRIGASLRPGLETQLGVVSITDGPKYDIHSTLCGSIFTKCPPKYSFTTASTRTGPVKKETHTPPFILQPQGFSKQ